MQTAIAFRLNGIAFSEDHQIEFPKGGLWVTNSQVKELGGYEETAVVGGNSTNDHVQLLNGKLLRRTANNSIPLQCFVRRDAQGVTVTFYIKGKKNGKEKTFPIKATYYHIEDVFGVKVNVPVTYTVAPAPSRKKAA